MRLAARAARPWGGPAAGLLLALACLPALATEPLPAQGTVQVLFTPWDDAEGALLKVIDEARHSIHVQAFILTSRNLAKALENAHRRGVRVEVLADVEQATKNPGSLVQKLHETGIPVWFEVRYASAHNKIMLIDAEDTEPVVVTGSYNFSYSAQARNAENMLILRGNASLAHAYLGNWRRHREEALPYVEVIRK
ncbi:MAG: phospholipase D family protein [Gammaproteobacteria bacterium]|nr:phospholipase D family protein [Gammaproteobacteria bacterium]MBU1416786.1 phospholipase D family protein [Gammaproteobacteria bacterium]